MARSGALVEIKAQEGIDVLTSLGELVFDECMGRSVVHIIDGVNVNSLCLADLETAANIRTR